MRAGAPCDTLTTCEARFACAFVSLPPHPPLARMSQHYNILAYLFFAVGALTLLSGIVVGFVLGSTGALAGDPEAAQALSIIGGSIWVILVIFALPYFAAGYGLLKRQNWGRILAMIMGALSLLSIPLGTALGIYALWALTRPEAQVEFA